MLCLGTPAFKPAVSSRPAWVMVPPSAGYPGTASLWESSFPSEVYCLKKKKKKDVTWFWRRGWRETLSATLDSRWVNDRWQRGLPLHRASGGWGARSPGTHLPMGRRPWSCGSFPQGNTTSTSYHASGTRSPRPVLTSFHEARWNSQGIIYFLCCQQANIPGKNVSAAVPWWPHANGLLEGLAGRNEID